MTVKINLNEFVKVKLTDLGKEIYYHRHDALNEYLKKIGAKPIEPHFPKEDEEGYTKFQLWNFMEIYGKHLGMAKPNVILPLEIIAEVEVQHDD